MKNHVVLSEQLAYSSKANPFWFVGPCVLEKRETTAKIAETLAKISLCHKIPIVFKASFDKANRTSHESYRGTGLEEGIRELRWVKENFSLPILTDVHERDQIMMVAEVADIIQIPAFLCRQTDLIAEACKSERAINIKKGQFIAPSNVKSVIEKLKDFGAKEFWITERGVCFGYQRLIVDFAAFPEMEAAGAPLVLDITHSVQLPGELGNSTGGIRDAIPYLCRAGAAVGVQGFFAETHPNPKEALSDGPNAWPLSKMEELMLQAKEIAEVTHGSRKK